MLEFQYPKYRAFFETRLCQAGEALDDFADLFDFRLASVKRDEFGRIRNARLAELTKRFGRVCMLHYARDCDIASGICLDHLIPLSSNKLNKELLLTPTSRGVGGRLHKTPSESFGSNNPRNLVLACVNCNSFKQNKFIDANAFRNALSFVANMPSPNNALERARA